MYYYSDCIKFTLQRYYIFGRVVGQVRPKIFRDCLKLFDRHAWLSWLALKITTGLQKDSLIATIKSNKMQDRSLIVCYKFALFRKKCYLCSGFSISTNSLERAGL